MSTGALDASVTLDEVLKVVGAKRVPLAPELAGYLVLEIAERADPAGGDVDPRSVFVGEEGSVALVRPKRENVRGDAEASIRSSLARLLEASGSQTPALAAASKRRNGSGLPALAEELEAALIPVNRAAGRRALARLAREVKRVTLSVGRHTLPSSPGVRTAVLPTSEPTSARRISASAFPREEDPTTTRSQIPSELMKRAGSAPLASETPTAQLVADGRPPSPSQGDVDALIAQFGVSGGSEQQQARALKAMVGLDPTPPTPPEVARRFSREPTRATGTREPSGVSDVEALLAMNVEPSKAVRTPTVPSRRPASLSNRGDERLLPTQPSQLKAPTAQSARTRPKRGLGRALLGALVAIAVGSYAVWHLRSGPDHHESTAAESSARPAARDALPVCAGTLLVADVPPHTEVLLHQGQAPVEVPRMPIGARLEFVATAEGYAPKRVVVPAGAGWDTGLDGKPRFEAAVQLEPSHAHSGNGDPWPAPEPGSAVGGDGPPGTVRVVATPRGAEIWMVTGMGPEARIDHLRCDQDIDVLLAGPTTYRKRLHVGASDFVADATATKSSVRIAHVSAK